MTNVCVLMGRLTKDPELKQTPNGISVLAFTIAVDRNSKDKQTDFINCVAWRQTAEFISKFFSKGRMIAVEGSIQTRSYEDKDGKKHIVTEVVVNQANFTGEAKSDVHTNPADSIGNPDDYVDMLSDDETIPF